MNGPHSTVMDIALIKTFLEVAGTGSFVAAAERLFVSQSAISLRIQRLEDELGRPLCTRSKSGAVLTPAGREFHHYALSILKLLEEARLQIALPEGYDTMSITNDTDVLYSNHSTPATNDLGLNMKVTDRLSTRFSYQTDYNSTAAQKFENTLGVSLVVGF